MTDNKLTELERELREAEHAADLGEPVRAVRHLIKALRARAQQEDEK